MSANEQPREDSLVTPEHEQGTIIGPRVDPSPFRRLVLAVAGLDEENLRPDITGMLGPEETGLPDDPDVDDLDAAETVEPEGTMPGRRDWPIRERPQTRADILLSYIQGTIPEGHFPAYGNLPGPNTEVEKRQLRVAMGNAIGSGILKDPESKKRYEYLQELYMSGAAAAKAMSVGRPQ